MASEPAEPRDREIELKRGLPDRASFERLLAAALARPGAEREPERIQDNHFFDTPDRTLGAAGLSLRVRCEAERRILTVKGPARPASPEAPAVREELERRISVELADAVLRGAEAPETLVAWLESHAPASRDLLRGLRRAAGEESIVPLGHFRNLRTAVRLELELAAGSRRVTLEFDESRFAGERREFEVELELASESDAESASRELRVLCESAGVESFASRSKLSRMLDAQDS